DVEKANAAPGGGMPGDGAATPQAVSRGARFRDADESAPVTAAEPPAAPPAPSPDMAKKAPAKEKGGKASAPIALRTDFSALALFSPSVRTDADGTASVPLKLPDNLTRYRIMAVAVAGEK